MATNFDKDVSAFGVPLHNPFYSSKEALCRFNLYNLSIKVKDPAIIADLVPKPLEYMGPTIHVSANRVQEFKTSLASYISHMAWNEIEIQIPTTYNKKYYLYCSEVFTDNVGIVIPDRHQMAGRRYSTDRHGRRRTGQWRRLRATPSFAAVC